VRSSWEDVATRARGLTPHLLAAPELDALAHAPDRAALADALRSHGFLLGEEAAVTPDVLELAVRRNAAAQLATLARWAGRRSASLTVVYEDEDRRSLRSLLRGAVQRAPVDERLGGLMPTPTLPERALAELAQLPTPREIAVVLTAWGNPYGPALADAAAATHPDLLALELQLSRTFAARALRGARAAGNRVLIDFVRETIDIENACTALVLVDAEPEAPATPAFVEGGRRLSLAAFLDAVRTHDPAEASRRIAAAFGPPPGLLSTAFDRYARDPALLEELLLSRRIATLRQRARRDPAGMATILQYVLELRAQVLTLRRIIWGVALDAPRGDLARAALS
jgi:vacuolar-type H+-ATPase subunit C/Vma6